MPDFGRRNKPFNRSHRGRSVQLLFLRPHLERSPCRSQPHPCPFRGTTAHSGARSAQAPSRESGSEENSPRLTTVERPLRPEAFFTKDKLCSRAWTHAGEKPYKCHLRSRSLSTQHSSRSLTSTVLYGSSKSIMNPWFALVEYGGLIALLEWSLSW